MDARPGQTAFRLMNGWDSGASTAVFGRWVGSEDGTDVISFLQFREAGF